MCVSSSLETLSVENLKTDISSKIWYIKNGNKTASKTQKKHIFQTSLLCVHSTERFESMFTFSELETLLGAVSGHSRVNVRIRCNEARRGGSSL